MQSISLPFFVKHRRPIAIALISGFRLIVSAIIFAELLRIELLAIYWKCVDNLHIWSIGWSARLLGHICLIGDSYVNFFVLLCHH